MGFPGCGSPSSGLLMSETGRVEVKEGGRALW